MAKKKGYERRTDPEKIQSQWHKLTGLHSREEWSAAIVRAATAAEIAANFSVRKEFASKGRFRSDFVNSLLRWANGLDGKMNRLLLPITKGTTHHRRFADVKKDAEEINQKRNAIVHQGEFCNADESAEVILRARLFIETVVRIYKPKFRLRDQK